MRLIGLKAPINLPILTLVSAHLMVGVQVMVCALMLTLPCVCAFYYVRTREFTARACVCACVSVCACISVRACVRVYMLHGSGMPLRITHSKSSHNEGDTATLASLPSGGTARLGEPDTGGRVQLRARHGRERRLPHPGRLRLRGRRGPLPFRRLHLAPAEHALLHLRRRQRHEHAQQLRPDLHLGLVVQLLL